MSQKYKKTPRLDTHAENYRSVLLQSAKIVNLHSEYGVTIPNLAKRYATSIKTIQNILRESR
jgi:DNA-binding transcriptional regulator YiaG